MAFGGFFGGSSSSNDKDKDNSSSSSTSPSEFASSQPPPPSPLFASQTPNSGSSSADIKNRLTQAIAQQSNILNAKALISKINENCFDHCVSAPGSSLSSKEQSCLSSCMEKYIEGWNVVSRTYVSRLQKEQQAQGMSGVGGNGGGIF